MRSLGKTLLASALLHSVFQGQICLQGIIKYGTFFFFKSGIGAYDSIYKNSFLLVFIHCFDKYILSVYHVLDFVVMVYIDLKFATYSREHCIFKNIFVFN